MRWFTTLGFHLKHNSVLYSQDLARSCFVRGRVGSRWGSCWVETPWISCPEKSQRQNSCHWTSSQYYPQHLQILNIIRSVPHYIPVWCALSLGMFFFGLDGIPLRTLLSQDHNHHDGNVCLSRDWRRLPKVSCQISGRAPCKMRHWSCDSIVIFYYDVTLAVSLLYLY